MLELCDQLGVGTSCLPVYYERLVLDTERTVRRVLQFLGLPWTDAVLRHQDFVAASPSENSSHTHKDKVILNKCVCSLLNCLNETATNPKVQYNLSFV